MLEIECPIHGKFKQKPAKHLIGQGCPECGKLKRARKRRKTTKEFIEEANAVHPNHYTYEKTVYRAHNQGVEITCPLHGSFSQQPGVHLSGGGCPACARTRINDSKRKTSEQFIREARKVHQNRYSYVNTRYLNSRTPVVINCSIHGEFTQQPGNHLNGQGCPKCGLFKRGNTRRTTTEQFKEKAGSIHGDLYSYENTEYRTNNTLVEIICAKHGPFFQKPSVHLSGAGCPKCGHAKISHSKRKSAAQFVSESRAVHKDRYAYPNVVYKNCKTPVEIECHLHGAFKQAPSNHLNGQGCPVCAEDVRNSKKRSTTPQFIAKASKVHQDFYSYEKTVYRTNKQKVEITCPIHGSFSQTPDDHLSGCGCPACAEIKRQAARKKPLEQFITEANTVHKHRYSYQKVRYINAFTPVVIECPDHGEFSQSPDSHLRGSGCPRCGLISRGLKRRSTLEEYIQKANKVHQNVYSYEESVYQTSHQAIKIICPTHGPFYQAPTDHLSGNGCQKCGRLKAIESLRKNPEQFIQEANAIHHKRYSYLNCLYIDFLTPVRIDCPDHGEFERTPSIHLQGIGCPLCRKVENRLKRQEQFVRNAKEIHGNRYEYQQVHYINSRIHITIICPVHGPYKQNPGSHLAGHHCMQCYLDLLKRGYFKETIRTCR